MYSPKQNSPAEKPGSFLLLLSDTLIPLKLAS